MPIFQNDDGPLAFHLDASIREGARHKLEADIKEHGGTVVERLSDADFAVVDELRLRGGRTLLSLNQAYASKFPNLRFRALNFVQSCIRQGGIFTPLINRKAMGGVPPRRQVGRVEYTHQDDVHLAGYLAEVAPNPASGGRTGNSIYKTLYSNPDIPWARKHPWESWRTRYKNKREWFDGKIAEIVRVRPANPEALHPQDRTLNRRPYSRGFPRHRLTVRSGDDDDARAESPAIHLREEEEERTDEEADPPSNRHTPLSPAFRPSPVNTQKTNGNLGKRARRPRDSESEEISQLEPATLGKRARRHTGGDESPLKRARLQEDNDDEVRADQDAINLDAQAGRDIEYFFYDALNDFHPEPGPSNTQRTLVDHSFPPVETLDPAERSSPPRSSQTTTSLRLPRTSQQTLVGSSPRPQPSRKGKERMIHFDSDSADEDNSDLFGDPIPPDREAEAATSNATPSPPKEGPDARESQPPPSEEPDHSDSESTDDLFDQTGYDMSQESKAPAVEIQDDEEEVADSDVGSADDLFDMTHKSPTPVAETQDEEPEIEDSDKSSTSDLFDQTGYDMLDESQYPTVETQEEEQDIEDLLLADTANSSTRSNVTEPEHVSSASQRESSSEGSGDEQSLDTDDRQINAIHKISRSLSTPSRHSSFGPNDNNSPEQSQSDSDLDSDDAQTRDTIQASAMPVSPAISATSSLGMSPIPDTKILPEMRDGPGPSTRNSAGSTKRGFKPPSDNSDEVVVPSPGIRARLRSAKTQPLVDPKTPKRAAALSDSSVDNTIPSPFTRAWQVKQELDRAAKLRPYEPPPGTRAARVRSERKL
ncbi:DNA-binding protein RAP1 [Pleurotus pulmonarius]